MPVPTPAVSLLAAAAAVNVLCHPRGLLEPRGFGKTSKDPEVRNVVAAAPGHHRTDPVDAILFSGIVSLKALKLSSYYVNHWHLGLACLR